MLPIVTAIGLELALCCGSVLRDDLLRARVGREIVSAIGRDFYVVQGRGDHAGAIFAAVNLLVELAYSGSTSAQSGMTHDARRSPAPGK